ncbi:DNA gyrase subunit A [Rubrivirga marina]|uniref:DNA gyrase subunit A n=1 Tax=Rubrivirga marina TaxID=1196024 RepID=A0A271IZQ2_9BACT|nr:DNA gyrase subunit A [Rubrivirga marina]PAP76716.1 DNA gyrase subunit A [Rubrivirga marina]
MAEIPDSASRIIPINIEEEMKSSYIDYSMSVIVSRALPDVRDGLKPVQRRVLYGMQELGLAAGRAHKKSARIVGEVLGKYHPHGDQSVYDALVRMAQDFNVRGPLVDGQGNFGSIDGDSAAAMRYTEARLTRLSEELLRDLDKETVDYTPNFDGSLNEPSVLPAALPNLLLNGASGIAVGMATNIPPHNLGELVDGIVAYIEDPEVELDVLMEHIPAPDFPTGGVIYGVGGVREAYRTGRGRVVMRAKMHEEEIKRRGGDGVGREALVVTEIPYQVNKSTLIEKIAHAVRDKKVDGIADLRDESDRDGMRIVMELRRDAVPEVTKNQLFKYTQLQQTFGMNMIALVGGRPKTLGLKDMIRHYVDHRHEIVVRRTEFELRKAEERAHILEGLTIALDHLDAVISIIRHSADTDAAKVNLMRGVYPQRLSAEQRDRLGLPERSPVEITGEREATGYALSREDFTPQPWLSSAQADAILALRLSRLTGLERDKIAAEYRDILQEVERLQAILASRDLRMQIIADELREVAEKYADPRRTEIDIMGGGDIDLEDLIEDEHVVVTITNQGLIKRTAIDEYRSQNRGGTGHRGTGTRDEDFVEHLFTAGAHDYLLFFTDHGQCYWLRVYNVPEGSRTAKGRSIRNLIQIDAEDRVRAVIALKKEDFRDDDFLENHFVTMATKQGLVKKTALSAFKRPLVTGIIAIDIVDGDQLIEAHLTDGGTEILLGSSEGQAIRFHESDVRSMGRKSRGVRGMKLPDGEQIVGMIAVRRDGAQVLTISQNGFGKRTPVETLKEGGEDGETNSNYTFRLQSRGGKGVLAQKTTAKTGPLVALKSVLDDDQLMIATEAGIMIRMAVSDISTYGRNTQGVRILRLKDHDAIADVARVVIEDEEDVAILATDGDAVPTEAADDAPEADE